MTKIVQDCAYLLSDNTCHVVSLYYYYIITVGCTFNFSLQTTMAFQHPEGLDRLNYLDLHGALVSIAFILNYDSILIIWLP